MRDDTFNQETAVKLVRWYTEYDCCCPLVNRVERLLGSFGGGVDATSVRSRPALYEEDKKGDKCIPFRITSLIEGILLERALTKPDLAAAAFDVSEKLVYCSCNNTQGNFDVSSMTIWIDGNNSKKYEVTCPSCTVEKISGGAESIHKKPMSLLAFFNNLVEKEAFAERIELKKLYLSLLTGSAAGGGGMYKDSSQQSSFNGSWTSLLFHTSKKDKTRLEAEVLVSNKIKHTSRLQPRCVCSDLLYALCSTTNNSASYAYKARNLCVIEGGEFLYFKYTIFEENGPFDSKTDLQSLVNNEPVSETNSSALAASSSSLEDDDDCCDDDDDDDDDENEKTKKKQPKKQTKKQKTTTSTLPPISKTNHDNMLMNVLKKGAVNGKRKMMDSLSGKKGQHSKKLKTSAAAGGGASSDVVAGENEEENNPSSVSPTNNRDRKDYVLPCPQIEEVTIFSQHRMNNNKLAESVVKHSVVINGNCLNLFVTQHRKKYILPHENILFCPPLVQHVGFNKFRILTGVSCFFDRIEIVFSDQSDSVVLSNNAAHSAILRLLSYIRENSLKRSVRTASVKGIDFVVKSQDTNIGIPLSNKEIRERQLCSASTLSMLAGLGK
uniref:Wsv440 n=1 Tax=White spot syndrome virus TaxID=342409 RepID=A0A8E7C037_9VIRU|nr:MAG: hypothetical protein EDAONDGI_00079 [White spot syndrome virus]